MDKGWLLFTKKVEVYIVYTGHNHTFYPASCMLALKDVIGEGRMSDSALAVSGNGPLGFDLEYLNGDGGWDVVDDMRAIT